MIFRLSCLLSIKSGMNNEHKDVCVNCQSHVFPPESWSALLHWIRFATWAWFQLHLSIPTWPTKDAGLDGTQMAAASFMSFSQLPEDIWKVPTLAVSSTNLSSNHVWFKQRRKQRAGLGRRDHVFYWQWLTEAQAVKPWVTFTEGTHLKSWHTCRCSEPALGTFIDVMWYKCLPFTLANWYELSVTHQVQTLTWPEGAWAGPLQPSHVSFEN